MVRVTVEPDPQEPSVAGYPVVLFDDVGSDDQRTTADAQVHLRTRCARVD